MYAFRKIGDIPFADHNASTNISKKYTFIENHSDSLFNLYLRKVCDYDNIIWQLGV